jgi:hypothetical protein
MLNCLLRHRLRFCCAILVAICGAGLVAILGAAALGLAAKAQAQVQAQEQTQDVRQAERLATTGQGDAPILIREHAGWDGDCAAIAPPALTLDRPPQHGFVCAQAGDVTVHTMYVGTAPQCVGRRVRGVRLFYVPEPGYAGSDGLQYSVQYPSVRRTVAVTVTVAAGSSRAQAVPADTVGMGPDAGQASGAVPACLGPVS